MLDGKKILVLGSLGKSGRAAVELYRKLGASVSVTDTNAELSLPEHWNVEDLRPSQDPSLLDRNFDFLVTAPGIPLSLPIFLAARERKLDLFGENDFAWEIIRRTWKKMPAFIAITGTDGKSTTTALASHILSGVGLRSVPCGNFGKPLSEVALSPDSFDALVVECSSFQLEAAHFFHPETAVILNLASDHLDRYPDMDAYLNAKLRIALFSDSSDLFLAPSWICEKAKLFLGASGKKTEEFPRFASIDQDTVNDSSRKVFFQGREFPGADRFTLPGRHNRENLLYSLAILEEFARRRNLSLDLSLLASSLASFKGLPHRIEAAGQSGGIRFYNDSKATTVQAVIAALSAFPDEDVFLLVGGRDKGADFAPLGNLERVRLYPFGEAGPKVAHQTGEKTTYPNLKSAFDAAVKSAREIGRGVVLLSPGCASYDAYRSYSERGEHFRKLAGEAVQ